VTRSCYPANKSKEYINYSFVYSGKTYQDSNNNEYAECSFFKENDSIKILISTKYPGEFNEPLIMFEYDSTTKQINLSKD
jgi:hypothetical protein